jgi:hypothetical protein
VLWLEEEIGPHVPEAYSDDLAAFLASLREQFYRIASKAEGCTNYAVYPIVRWLYELLTRLPHSVSVRVGIPSMATR